MPGAQALLKPVLKPHELGPIWNLMPQMHYVSNPLNKTVNHLLSHAHRRLAVKQLPDGTLMLSGGAHVAYTPEGLWKGSLSAMTQNVTDAILTFPFIDNSTFLKADASRVETCRRRPHPADRPGGSAPEHDLRLCLVWPRLRDLARLHQALHGLDRVWEKPEALEPFSPARFHKPAAILAASSVRRAA